MEIDKPVFVTGVNGQLGHDVILELNKREIPCICSDITDVYKGIDDSSVIKSLPYFRLDITDESSVSRVISDMHPSAIVHCAAWTAVDAAEDEENKNKVYKINVEGTKNLANACKSVDAKMIYISTDYVFNGLGDNAWDPDYKGYEPQNNYGKTKLEGELVVSSILEKYFIVRIAWVFGKNGNNFVKTMLKLSDKYDSLRVVNDQIGSPTYTVDLSKLLVDMLLTDKYGYYHATNEGDFISWADFASEIMKQANKSTKIIPVSTVEYGLSKAKRPYNSRLDKSKLSKCGFDRLPNWKDALARYLKELENGTN